MVNDSQGKYTHFLTITCYPKFPPGSIDVWSNNETRLVVIKDISEIKHLSLFFVGIQWDMLHDMTNNRDKQTMDKQTIKHMVPQNGSDFCWLN